MQTLHPLEPNQFTAACRRISRFKPLQVLVKLYLTYLVFSVLVVLPLLNALIKPLYTQETGRHLNYQLVGFNPFTLGVFGYGLEDRDPKGQILWAIENLQFNPSLVGSVIHGAIGIDEIRLLGLTLNVEQIDDGMFNISDIIEHQAALAASRQPSDQSDIPARGQPLNPAEQQQDFALPRLWIGEFELDATQLSFTDSHREKAFTTGLKDFHFTLVDFSTLNPEGDGYYLRADSAQGGTIEWRGDISAKQEKTWGQFTLTHFSLLPIWQFMEPQLNFFLSSGFLNFSGDFEVDWSDSFHWQLRQTQISVDKLALQQRGQSTAALSPTYLSWQSLGVFINSLDGKAQLADIENITLSGLDLRSGHHKGRLALADTFALTPGNHNDNTNAPTGDSGNELSASDKEKTQWQLSIARTAIESSRAEWQVGELDNRNLTLSPLQAQVENFNLASAPAKISGFTRIDDQAEIHLSGDWVTHSQSLNADLALDQLPLAWANPLLDDFLLAHFVKGELNLRSELRVAGAELNEIDGTVEVSDLLLADTTNAQVAKIERISLDNVRYTAKGQSVVANQLTLAGLNSQLHIKPDGTTNIQDLFVVAEEVSNGEAAGHPEASPAAATQDRAAESDSAESKTTSEALSWQLAEVAVENATIAFTDQTPISTFNTKIQSLDGRLSRLSSNAEIPWQVGLTGNVDGYAPVNLNGTAQPLLADPAMDLALNFTAMDLAVFNPYSTTFTGWQIEKGHLSVYLDYQLQNKRIVGENRVVLDQLDLGERVDSSRLVDIPLKLALALITDEHGIADLEVPVRGTTDDPSFSFGAIIWAAVRNSVMKLVTAPFNFLASLVDTKEDLGSVAFEPLSSQLNEQAEATLASLKQALDQRPQLRLGITGDIEIAAEGNALKRAELTQTMLTAGLSQADINEKSSAWRSFAHQQLNQAVPEVEVDAAILESQLLAQIAQPTEKLAALSQARAVAVKQYLVQTLAMDPTRLFIKSEPVRCPRKDRCSDPRAIFSIEPE